MYHFFLDSIYKGCRMIFLFLCLTYFTQYDTLCESESCLCPTPRDPMDYTVHAILQARILESVAFSFSRGSSQPGLNPGLPQCRQNLYQLSHKGSPRILEWVVYPFFSGSSLPRNQPGVSCFAVGFFTS